MSTQTQPFAGDGAAEQPTTVMPPVNDNTASEEVEYEQAKIDQAVTEPQTEKTPEDDRDVLDALVPKAKSVTWEIGPENMRRQYVQRPLSFIAKMQWFSLVGEVLDKALSGPEGMSLNSLFSAPNREGALSVDDFRDADTFVQAVGKLLSVAPRFLVDSYCIWLSVPDYERDLVSEIMALPPDEGGLTDEQGMEIIEVFIDQNYEALDRFFRERIGSLQKRVQARVQDAQQSRQSMR